MNLILWAYQMGIQSEQLKSASNKFERLNKELEELIRKGEAQLKEEWRKK